MSCDVTYEQLAAFTAGDATGRSDDIGRHVESCATCQRRIAALAGADRALGGLVREEPSSTAVLKTLRMLMSETRQDPAAGREIMTLEEAADFLRISGEEIEAVLMQLPAFEVAGQIRIRRDKLQEWIESRELSYVRNGMASEFARMIAERSGKGVA